MVKNIVALILMFLYFYTITFSFLAFSTTVIFGIFGFLWFGLLVLQDKISFTINKHMMRFLILLFSVGSVSMVSLAINSTRDIKFISYVFSSLAIIFASYFVIKILKKMKYELSFESIGRLIINVIFIQSIIAFSMFLIPELKEFLLGLEKLTADQYERVNALFEFRIFGLGASKTFMAGIYNGFGLMLMAIFFRMYKFSFKQLFIFSFKFLLIFLVGMMMARTTLVGALLAISIILMPKDFKATISMVKKRFLFITLAFIVPIVIILLLMNFSSTFAMTFGRAIEYGFEMFVNYFAYGSFETDSTNELKTLYVFPTEIKTYIIGDGYWAHPTDIGQYYMNTDVGYLRLIYYFGIVGLLTYLSMQMYLIVRAYKSFNIGAEIYLFVVAYLLVLNLKGFTDLLFIHILFVMAYLLNKDTVSEHKTRSLL